MPQDNDKPVGYEEPSKEELDTLAAMGIGMTSAPPDTEPAASAGAPAEQPPADGVTPEADGKGKEPEAPSDLPPPFLPPPDAVPPTPTRLDDNVEIDYVGPDGRTLTTTLGKAREAARRLHGLDALQRQLAPYREMDEGAKAVKDPALRARMISEMRSIVDRYRSGKIDEKEAAPRQSDLQAAEELRARLAKIEERFASADEQRARQREDDERVQVAQGRIDRMVGYTKQTFGIELSEEEIDKTVDRCVQIHKIALSTKDPVRRRQLEDIAQNPVEVWLHDNRERVKQMQINAAKAAERGHVESLRKGAVNPGGTAPTGGRAPVSGMKLEAMSEEQQDRLTKEEYAALEAEMISRLGGG